MTELISVKAEPKKRLSQNFLIAPEFPMEIAELVPLLGKKVLEIGAGTGFLTVELARHAGQVVAIEIDADLIAELRGRLKKCKNVDIIVGDAMAQDVSGFDCIFGALPYHLSSPLLFKITESGVSNAVLVVQKEFGLRLAALPGEKDWSRLSVMVQAGYRCRVVDIIPAICFWPEPGVDSAIVHLSRKQPADRVSLDPELVAALFQHKNQTVKKSLLHSSHALGKGKGELLHFVSSLPKNLASKRPRALSLLELSDLSRRFKAA